MTRSNDLRAILRDDFGFDSFRGPQEEICRHVIDGGDALVIMATGDGKSLCYQLPAMAMPGLTLCVSPLIALMDDQVLALEKKGLPATCIHSMLDSKERKQRLERALRGEVSLLYVTPERFRVPGFLDALRDVEISLMAVDEAHCLSQWGHDFRPDYQRLGEMREALGSPPCLALTATATPPVQDDIVAALRMPDAERWHTGIERPNLFLGVESCDNPEDKMPRLFDVVERVGGPGIVYCALIKDLRKLEDEFRAKGYDPLVYHGKLSASERREQQARFIDSKDAVILATNAFGMGVDKPDIRFIAHYQVPRTLEAYYQEIGRAGRDGRPSLCELYFCEEDISIQREFTEWANPDQDFFRQVAMILQGLGERAQNFDVQDLRASLLIKNRRDGRVETCLRLLRSAGCVTGDFERGDFEWIRMPDDEEVEAWLPDDKRHRDLSGLLEMVRYASHPDCRKNYIHHYFGFEDAFPDGCMVCDGEVPAADWLDRHLPAAETTAVPKKAARLGSEGRELHRGDWIEIRGHGLCAITRVHRNPSGTRIDVERARDLQSKSFDLGRIKWRKVED